MNNFKKPMIASASAALLLGLSSYTLAETTNPFVAEPLAGGYTQLAEGSCGEGKCGDDKKADKEGKCGEGKCGEGKDKKKADKEGKCGEGKCGEEKADNHDENADGED